MQPFTTEDGVYVARLDAAERAVLLQVVEDVVALLDPGDLPDPDDHHVLDTLAAAGEAPQAPEDPAVLRLLPSASPDPDVAAEFRRLTETDLRMTKVGQLRRLHAAVLAANPELVVVPSEAGPVAAALTDLRLVVSERLGVRTEKDADALYSLLGTPDVPDEDGEGGARRFLATLYVVLGLVQESLVEAMLADLPDPGEGHSPSAGS